jgi:single-strand DNA-binding protein
VSKSVNKVILLGNVGQNPKMQKTNGGTLKAAITLATNDRRKDQQGNWQDQTEWHRLICFGRTAEIVQQYVSKGSKLMVEGKLHSYSYEDNEQQTRYVTEVIVFDLVLLDGKQQSTGGSHSAPPDNSGPIDDNDIPF